jgi:hypothetical protein
MLYAKLAFCAYLIFAGWHLHTIYDGYLAKGQTDREIAKAREGETAIIKFNRDYAKEKANAPHDNCIDRSHPAWVNRLLNE